MFKMRASMFSHLIDVGQPFNIALGKVSDSNRWRWQTGAKASSGAAKPTGFEGRGFFCDRFFACAISFRSKGDGFPGRQLSQKGQRFAIPGPKKWQTINKGHVS